MGAFLILLSAVGFGSMASCARFAYQDGVDTLTLLALRFAIATVLLGASTVARRASFPRGRALATFVAMGVFYAATAWAYFSALHYTASATVALVLYTFPILVALAAAVLRIDRFGINEVLALCVSSLGLYLVLGGSLQDLNWGAVLALAAALFYSCYILIGSRVAGSFDSVACSTIVLATASACFLGMGAVLGLHWPHGTAGWIAVVGVAVLGTAVAIAAFVAGLRRLGPTQTALLSTLEPVVTVILGIVVLGETPTPRMAAGGGLILAAAAGLTIARARGRAQQPTQSPMPAAAQTQRRPA